MYQTSQRHSETSRQGYEDAEAEGIIEKQGTRVLLAVCDSDTVGKTGKEIARELKIGDGRASARLRDLEIRGQIIKTSQKREGGYVWVSRTAFRETMGRAPSANDFKEKYLLEVEERQRMARQMNRMKLALEVYATGKTGNGSLARSVLFGIYGEDPVA